MVEQSIENGVVLNGFSELQLTMHRQEASSFHRLVLLSLLAG